MDRTPIEHLGQVASGDTVEVELVVDSKNDYEYVVLEDMKAAGFEPVEVRSGYNGNELGAGRRVPRRTSRPVLPHARARPPQRNLPPPCRNAGPIQCAADKGVGHVRAGTTVNSDEFRVALRNMSEPAVASPAPWQCALATATTKDSC